LRDTEDGDGSMKFGLFGATTEGLAGRRQATSDRLPRSGWVDLGETLQI
jgi:hypothetical protein